MYLIKDGVRTKQSKTVSAQEGWTFRFEHLPKFAAGREIVYTVEEEAVEDYRAAVTEEGNIINTLNDASYQVEWYFQENGVYPNTPSQAEERRGIIGRLIEVAEEDKTTLRERYRLDEAADNVLSGTVEEDGSLVLKLYFRPYYVITFDPNGGILGDSAKPVSSNYAYGEEITIREAPSRADHAFQYWKGSKYQPGDKYTVTEDHTFVAQWKEKSPYTFRFSFTKEWIGGEGSSIDWTFYNADGTVNSRTFSKKEKSKNRWAYEVWLEAEGDYYLIEKPVQGYAIKYENVGKYADITDRCMNGGKIINHKIPRTGDPVHPAIGLAAVALSLLGMAAMKLTPKKRSVGKRK